MVSNDRFGDAMVAVNGQDGSCAIVTGAPVNILITTSVTPGNVQIEQQLGNAPQNSDSSPAAMAVKYVKVWSFK